MRQAPPPPSPVHNGPSRTLNEYLPTGTKHQPSEQQNTCLWKQRTDASGIKKKRRRAHSPRQAGQLGRSRLSLRLTLVFSNRASRAASSQRSFIHDPSRAPRSRRRARAQRVPPAARPAHKGQLGAAVARAPMVAQFCRGASRAPFAPFAAHSRRGGPVPDGVTIWSPRQLHNPVPSARAPPTATPAPSNRPRRSSEASQRSQVTTERQ